METRWAFPSMDEWQKEVLKADSNLILLCGRQVGKSEIMAKKIADYLLNNRNKKILIVSGVERQAAGLYNKVLRLIELDYPNTLKKGKDKPLKTVFKLKNGSILITEPIGLDGSGARQHTLDGVIFEEMQLIPEEAFTAITPMLFTTGGFIWMLGTAWATEGYVYDRLSDPDFKVFRINSEEVAENRPEPSRTIMLNFLEKERSRLSEAAYMQEYLAIPSDKMRQIYPDSLIKRQMILERTPKSADPNAVYICSVDPAGLGEDEGAISIFEKITHPINEEKDRLEQRDFIITKSLMTFETTNLILDLHKLYSFDKIYIDDGGLGFGVFSELMNEPETRSITIALNNSKRVINKDEKTKKILKEEMHFNLLNQMEKNKILLLKDSAIRESLKSCKFEYDKDTKKVKITSTYNHPTESIVRSAWELQEEDLKLSVYSIKV